VCDRLYVANYEARCLLQLASMRLSVFMSSKIENSAFHLHRYFKVSSRLSISGLKSPVGTQY
jgi:hypothetical protein